MRGLRALGLGTVLALATLALSSSAGASTIFYSSSSSFNFNAGSLWSIGADGSGARRLRAKLPEGPGGVVASVSRNGKHLFCLCRGKEIDSMKLDGSGFKAIGHRPTKIKYDYTVLGPQGEPFWFEGSHLMKASLNGKHERIVAKGPFEEELAIPQRGRRIAMSGGDATVFTAPLDGGPLTKIYHSSYPGLREIGEMSWSADGKKLVFVDFPEEEKYETPAEPASHAFLYAGGMVRELPLSEEIEYGPPIFSPDASKLASFDPEGSLYISSLAGGAARKIQQGSCSETCFFGNRLLDWVP